MKELFISDLKNFIGKEVEIQVLLKEVFISENRFNNKWQEMIVADKTGQMTIRAWEELINEDYYNLINKVVKVYGQVRYYQSRPEIQIIGMEEVKEYDWTDYVLTLDVGMAKQYAKTLTDFISMVQDHRYKALLEKIFDSKRIKRMALSVGGTLHHNYYGGLLLHTVETCEYALNILESKSKLVSLYEGSINKDLVIAGALLHDVGKLNSYSGFPSGEKTTRGLLVNSSVESVLYTTSYNSMLPKDMQVNDLGPLDHIILTAETIDEKGIYPRIIEAVIVNEANRESVKLDGFNMAFYKNDMLNENKNSLYSKINKTTILREV